MYLTAILCVTLIAVACLHWWGFSLQLKNRKATDDPESSSKRRKLGFPFIPILVSAYFLLLIYVQAFEFKGQQDSNISLALLCISFVIVLVVTIRQVVLYRSIKK